MSLKISTGHTSQEDLEVFRKWNDYHRRRQCKWQSAELRYNVGMILRSQVVEILFRHVDCCTVDVAVKMLREAEFGSKKELESAIRRNKVISLTRPTSLFGRKIIIV